MASTTAALVCFAAAVGRPANVTTVTCQIERPPEVVYATLADPHSYPSWLVGARAIRSVDPGWPAAGTQFHHRVGIGGPLEVADSTSSLGAAPPHRLELEVRARPLGRGRVTFELEPQGGGTEVTFVEEPVGALRWLRPLLDPFTRVRNLRSLDLLRELVEGEA
jgi:uncharacterized protein YndB with AHSA1/START domain